MNFLVDSHSGTGSSTSGGRREGGSSSSSSSSGSAAGVGRGVGAASVPVSETDM